MNLSNLINIITAVVALISFAMYVKFSLKGLLEWKVSVDSYMSESREQLKREIEESVEKERKERNDRDQSNEKLFSLHDEQNKQRCESCRREYDMKITALRDMMNKDVSTIKESLSEVKTLQSQMYETMIEIKTLVMNKTKAASTR